MSKSSPARLSCVGLEDRLRNLPVGARRRLVVIVLLFTAAWAVALGVEITTVVEVVALPPAAVKLADLAVGAGTARRRSRLQGR
ncbi:hypothetical protein ACIF6L_31430 [Kitasatospora sp. NPDC086009]|uniref:hypothetical protein n=1 Tax=unclassified Kitasatospora TaxID=2633591 RepID=UPI0037C541B4